MAEDIVKSGLYETLQFPFSYLASDRDIALEKACGGTCDLLSVGMPALDTTADETTLRAFAGDVFDPQSLILESDACMALEGVTGGDKGMIVICGTGSMALLDDGNGQRAAGGWGYLLGDPGSGYGIAMAGLRAAIRHWEGIGPDTGLRGRLLILASSSPVI